MSLPVVALHGFAGGPSSWSPTLGFVHEVSRHRQFLLPILPGHEPRVRASDVPSANVDTFPVPLCTAAAHMPPTFDQQAAALSRALRARRVGPFHLVGYSLGARWALALLAREPSLFASVLLISGHTGLASHVQRLDRRTADERWCHELRRSLPDFFRAWESQPLLRPTPRTSSSYLRERHRARQNLRAQGLTASLRHSGLGAMPDLSAVLATSRRPIRILLGARDERFGAHYASLRIRARLDVRTVPEAGHDLLGEAPEAVAAAALELWRECEASAWSFSAAGGR